MEIFIIIRYLVLNTHKEHILYQLIEMFCIIIFSCRKSNLSRFSGDRLARPSTMFPAVLNNLSVFLEVGVGVRNLLANLQRATLALTSFPASSYLLPRLGLFYSQGAGRDNCIPIHFDCSLHQLFEVRKSKRSSSRDVAKLRISKILLLPRSFLFEH